MKNKKQLLSIIAVILVVVCATAAFVASANSDAETKWEELVNNFDPLIGSKGSNNTSSIDAPVYAEIKETETQKREHLRTGVYEEFGIDLNELSFLSYSYLWSTNGDDLAPEYEPLKTILMDEVMVADKGEGLPDGVYYNDTEAYVARRLENNQIWLVHCELAPGDAWKQGERDEEGRLFNGYNYSVISVEISK